MRADFGGLADGSHDTTEHWQRIGGVAAEDEQSEDQPVRAAAHQVCPCCLRQLLVPRVIDH